MLIPGSESIQISLVKQIGQGSQPTAESDNRMKALKMVIITKLPFSVPDHPLLEARVERIRQNGGNPFVEYQVPEAAIKLRQGFGRLIRSTSDTGEVVILDPRIRTRAYGRVFLESLPECNMVTRSQQSHD